MTVALCILPLTFFCKSRNIYFLFYLYIYPPDWQESDGGTNT